MIAPTAKLDELDVLSLVGDAQRGDREAVSELCKRHRGWIVTIAINLHTSAMDIEDLVQEGMIGLLGAIESFDARKGASFKARVFIRVRGAMLDAIRHHGGGIVHVPRLAIQRGEVQRRYMPLRRGTTDDDDEHGEELGRIYTSDEETLDAFRSHLTGLEDRERYILEQYFVHDRYLKQIANDLDLSESRVCQMLNRSIAFIQARKQELTPQKPGRK